MCTASLDSPKQSALSIPKDLSLPCLVSTVMHQYLMLVLQIAFIGILYPSVMISYFGQSAWLIKNPSGYATSFFASIPWGDAFFYFYFVVAVLAACVASQTMISAAYSIVRQSMALRCFPRMKVIHTSTKVSIFCCGIEVLP